MDGLHCARAVGRSVFKCDGFILVPRCHWTGSEQDTIYLKTQISVFLGDGVRFVLVLVGAFLSLLVRLLSQNVRKN